MREKIRSDDIPDSEVGDGPADESGVSQDNSYEDELEGEDLSTQRIRVSGQSKTFGNARDGKNIQESKKGKRPKTAFQDIEKVCKKLSQEDAHKRGGKRSKGVPDKKSKYVMYQDGNQPRQRARRGSTERGRDSSK